MKSRSELAPIPALASIHETGAMAVVVAGPYEADESAYAMIIPVLSRDSTPGFYPGKDDVALGPEYPQHFAALWMTRMVDTKRLTPLAPHSEAEVARLGDVCRAYKAWAHGNPIPKGITTGPRIWPWQLHQTMERRKHIHARYQKLGL